MRNSLGVLFDFNSEVFNKLMLRFTEKAAARRLANQYILPALSGLINQVLTAFTLRIIRDSCRLVYPHTSNDCQM